MKDLIETLKQIDNDYYKGVYTTGERYDLIKELNEVLKRNHFINQ
jgi:protoheme ferro-lyase